jgi:hypothetical protein
MVCRSIGYTGFGKSVKSFEGPKIIAAVQIEEEDDVAADVLVRNAWYVAGLSHEFPPQRLQGQVIAEKPPSAGG